MSEAPVLRGARVTLRGPRERDIDDRFAAGKPDEYVYMCGGDRTENDEHPPRDVWVKWNQRETAPKEGEISWRMEAEGICIGSIRLHQISMCDHSARLAIGIWNIDYLSKGLGTEAIRLVLGYAFDTMRLHRVELTVLDYNLRGIRCYEKCGFRREGVLRESAFIEGEYHSDIIMSILEPEYRSMCGGTCITEPEGKGNV